MKPKHIYTIKCFLSKLFMALMEIMIIVKYVGIHLANTPVIFRKGIMNRRVKVGYVLTATMRSQPCLDGQLNNNKDIL